MPRLLLLLFLALFFGTGLNATDTPAFRPLEITVNFMPPFPREFTAYFNNPTAYSITVTNLSDQDQTVYFLAEMRGLTNNVLVQTRPEYRSAESLTIMAGETMMLTGEDVANLNEGIQLSDLNISGLPGGPSINGILPEGMYQFCINAYDFVLEETQPLSVGCGALVDITYADQLTILHPAEGDVILANPSSAFEMMWDPNESDPMRRMEIEYEVKMIDITTYPDEDLDILLRDGGPQVEFEEDMITDEFYLYNSFGTNFELEVGHQYAMRVRRVDPDPVPLINDGYSEIRTFWYGEIPEPDPEDVEETPQNISDCLANCEYTENFSETRKADAAGVTTLEVGHFTMTDVAFTGGTTGPTWRGTGTIILGGWMYGYPLAVSFDNIVINENNRVIAGEIKARDDSNSQYDLGDIHSRLDGFANRIPDTLGKMVNEHVLSLRMLDALLGDGPQGFPVGIEQELKGHKFIFALVGGTFTARGADVDIMSLIDLSSLNPALVMPLAGRDICLTPDGLGSEAMLYLSQDVVVPPLGGMSVALVGSSQPQIQRVKNRACYVEFDCDGLKELAVRGRVAFPRGTIVPDNNGVAVDTGRVTGVFEFTLDRNIPDSLSAYAYRASAPGPGQPTPPEAPSGNHIMLGFTMTPFQITGLEGWTFRVREATLDLSDVENPKDIWFPRDYAYSENVDTGMLWRGFHLNKLIVATPRNMRVDSQRTALVLRNILLDFEPSLTMDARVTNLIDKSVGGIDGWGFSLDTFQLKLVQNTLIDGRLMGKISSPIMGTADYLKYKAVLNRNQEQKYEFHAVAQPEKDSLIRLPMLLAKSAICPNSFIQFRTTPDSTYLQAFLTGQMSVDVTENLPDSVQQLNLLPELAIKFAEFRLNFDSENGFVTAGEVSQGLESHVGFAVDFQDEICGTNYNGPVFEDTDQPDYDYDVGDLERLLHDGVSDEEVTRRDTAAQETVSGFPITISDAAFNVSGPTVALEMNINLHLTASENHELKGTGRVGIASTLKRDGLKIKKFHVDSVYLSEITVGTEEDPIDLDFMELYGGVKFVNFSGGKGFQGALNVAMGPGLEIDLKAGFGKAGNPELGAYGTAQYHGWWYLDGMMTLPGQGIRMGPSGLRGLGGGVYWNCTAPGVLSIEEVMAAQDGDLAQQDEIDSGPAFGQRTILFRTMMDVVNPDVMIAQPEIRATWTAGQGLNELAVAADFWSLTRAAAPPMGLGNLGDRRESAKVWGEAQTVLRIERVGEDKQFAVFGGLNIYANLINNVLYGAGRNRRMVSSAFYMGHKDMVGDYDIGNISGNTYWFFNIGNPYENNMGGLVFDLPGFNLDDAGEEQSQLGDAPATAEVGAGVDFYLMAGMNVPDQLPEPPDRITELFGYIDGDRDAEPGNGMEAAEREDERDASATSDLTGLGFVVGAHAFASAEVNAVLYARLAILAGLDVMAFQYPEGTGCITEGGREIPEIGVNGWYGTGRAYVGLEGVLGAKGKLFGREIDVRIMHLVAAAMVEAGGPRPMWLKGRLGIYYSLLGGLIEGRARMKIDVGERCQPIGGNPFGIPLIVDTNPNEQSTDNVSALVHPKVSFSVPMMANPSRPNMARVVSVPDAEGNTRQLFAYVHEFSITPRGGGSRADYQRDQATSLLIQGGRAAEYRPEGYISAPEGVDETRNWRMRIVVRAKEKLADGRWVHVPGVGNSVFEEERVIDFTTDALPPEMQNEQVGMTKPFRFQHFFLQDDAGIHQRAVIYTRQQESNGYFRPTSASGFINYRYEGVVVDVDNNEEVARTPLTYYPGSRKAIFNLPRLANDRTYELYALRIATNQLEPGRPVVRRQTLIREGSDEEYEEELIDSEYEVQADVVDIGDLIELRSTEEIKFRWRFRTSEYNTLSEKMAAASIIARYNYQGFHGIELFNFEGLDGYDVYGKQTKFGTNQVDESRFLSDPLVTISDPFNSPFHTNQSKPLIGGFASMYNSDYAGQPTGIYSQIDVQVDMSDLAGSGSSGLPGSPGFPSDDNSPNGSNTTNVSGQIDLDWPIAPVIENSLNYQWISGPQEAILNERIAAGQLCVNTAQGLENPPANPNVFFRYYVTENVLADAEEMTNFYEYWRNRIMLPLDHVENILHVAQPVNIRQPDTRVSDLAPLDGLYLNLVNSPLVRRPPATILSISDFDEDVLMTPNDPTPPPAFSGDGLPTTITYVDNNDDGIRYRRAIQTFRQRGQFNRIGFSQELMFRAFFPDSGGQNGTVVKKAMQN